MSEGKENAVHNEPIDKAECTPTYALGYYWERGERKFAIRGFHYVVEAGKPTSVDWPGWEEVGRQIQFHIVSVFPDDICQKLDAIHSKIHLLELCKGVDFDCWRLIEALVEHTFTTSEHLIRIATQKSCV